MPSIVEGLGSGSLMQDCNTYIGAREGSYLFRTRRYKQAAACLGLDPSLPTRHALTDNDTLVDVGACMTEFDVYLRSIGWRGRYVPVDAAIDGTDLNKWEPTRMFEWFVGIEIVEHIKDPIGLINVMQEFATKGVVLTTPNPDVVDVLEIDPTHVSSVSQRQLEAMGFTVYPVPAFGVEGDTLLAAWQA